MGPNPLAPWEELADALLQREALVCRVGRGIPPRDLPGMYVDHGDVDRILARLPGLDGPALEDARAVAEGLEPGLRAAEERFHASLEGDGRFSELVRRARLDPSEAEVLALLAAVEVHPDRQRLAIYIQDDVNLSRVSLAALARIFGPEHPGPRAVAPGSRLARAGLVEVAAGPSWATSPVSVPSRVAWALRGDDSLDPALPQSTRRLVPDRVDPGGEDLVLVHGSDPGARLRTAVGLCRGTKFLVTPIPTSAEEWAALVREATVSGATVILELEGALSPEARRRIERADHLAWALCSPHEPPLESLPDRPWTEASADGIVEGADGFRLTSGQRELVDRAEAALGGDRQAAVRRLASGRLDGLALRVRPERGWEDLVLPPDQAVRLRELATRFRHRRTVYGTWGFRALPSAGLVALFAGPSGTGKTLAAEVIAGDLGLDLYKIDLSSVVSKYIGETEKNLDRIFAGAASAEVVLFFDEADALFGKRSEVSDAHDRYANIEVAYLLQRLETYDGLVVLATNLRRNMDQAFLRRIHLAVEFPMPEEEERRAIWQRSFPPEAPTEDLDLDFLARQFKISGGSIRNAALGAAFAAADLGRPISMDLVVLALEREFQKLGRLRTEAEFDRYFDLVKEEPDAVPV